MTERSFTGHSYFSGGTFDMRVPQCSCGWTGEPTPIRGGSHRQYMAHAIQAQQGQVLAGEWGTDAFNQLVDSEPHIVEQIRAGEHGEAAQLILASKLSADEKSVAVRLSEGREPGPEDPVEC